MTPLAASADRLLRGPSSLSDPDYDGANGDQVWVRSCRRGGYGGQHVRGEGRRRCVVRLLRRWEGAVARVS
ncbi:hypothetical protein ES332_D11G183800v1 [Gossypium tomentosum]|uniref:Uncharacterized protein n=1 Tax=Gossypium tomentosum TaxID=34277 RepID=A0A5D2IPN9_GOSTO|nr:hypothetical protein ES332_D11G183800v1 [Gossypium tomentosum]